MTDKQVLKSQFMLGALETELPSYCIVVTLSQDKITPLQPACVSFLGNKPVREIHCCLYFSLVFN